MSAASRLAGAEPVVLRLARMAAEAPERTLYTHLAFDGGAPVRLSRGETWRRARAVAAALAARGARGRPVLLVHPPGPEFAPALFGTLGAGAVAVPVPAPQFAAQVDRLRRVAADCRPAAALSTSAVAARLRARLAADDPLLALPWLDGAEEGEAAVATPAPGEVALLQYTSGSTAAPRGVALTHANLAATLDMLAAAFRPSPEAAIVSWLPHFHDMGLMSGILGPLGAGGASVLLSPPQFLQRPLRWLRAIADSGGELSGAPDFAYALCARTAPGPEEDGLDLRGWRRAFVGAEPVRPGTLDAFAARFRAAGFRREAFTPCYGLAEATVLVACKPMEAAPTVHRLSRAAARAGEAVRDDGPDALRLAGCGVPAAGTTLRIVDPATRRPLPPGRIGELWVSGPQVAAGYWNRGEPGVFGARLVEEDGGRPGALADGEGGDGAGLRTHDLGAFADREEAVGPGILVDREGDGGTGPRTGDLTDGDGGRGWLRTGDLDVLANREGSDRAGPRTGDLADGGGGGGRWLRTGDLGVMADGEFVFVDRLKDVVVVNGQTYACHDLERTVAASDPALGAAVALGLDVGDRTAVAVVAELPRDAAARAAAIASAIRAGLFTTHLVAPDTIAFVPPRRIARTTSGKLQRRLTAERLLAGTLAPFARFDAAPAAVPTPAAALPPAPTSAAAAPVAAVPPPATSAATPPATPAVPPSAVAAAGGGAAPAPTAANPVAALPAPAPCPVEDIA